MVEWVKNWRPHIIHHDALGFSTTAGVLEVYWKSKSKINQCTVTGQIAPPGKAMKNTRCQRIGYSSRCRFVSRSSPLGSDPPGVGTLFIDPSISWRKYLHFS